LQLDGPSSWELAPLRSPLDKEGYLPRLSGHETFPLRHGWLKKAFDAVCEEQEGCRSIFNAEDAIAWFGVGKNMVSSIRHWARAARVIREDKVDRSLYPTELGIMLFDDDTGLDPWMEHPSTSWLAHWHIAGHRRLTTWFWAFNIYPAIAFERETLVRGIEELAERRGWQRASRATIKRDVACLVRAYAPAHSSGGPVLEDSLESPLSELRLVLPTGKRDGFRFVRGPKPSLRAGVFSYAVNDYWSRNFKTSNTLSFEALAHGPGSPGRVFLLAENDLVDMLLRLEESTGGAYQWSETAGLRQLIRREAIPCAEVLRLIEPDYVGTS